MRPWVFLLIVHVVLLVLASTAFTAVTVLADGHYQWDYYTYHRQSGWGLPYEFPYSLPTVLTYIAAYASGLIVYTLAWRWGSRCVGGLGMAVCALGFGSFCYELAHWFYGFYNSWIISAPIVLFPLAVAAFVQRWRLARRDGGVGLRGTEVDPQPLARS